VYLSGFIPARHLNSPYAFFTIYEHWLAENPQYVYWF